MAAPIVQEIEETPQPGVVPQGTGFINPQDILAQNIGAGQQIAGQIGEQLGQRREELRGGIEEAVTMPVGERAGTIFGEVEQFGQRLEELPGEAGALRELRQLTPGATTGETLLNQLFLQAGGGAPILQEQQAQLGGLQEILTGRAGEELGTLQQQIGGQAVEEAQMTAQNIQQKFQAGEDLTDRELGIIGIDRPTFESIRETQTGIEQLFGPTPDIQLEQNKQAEIAQLQAELRSFQALQAAQKAQGRPIPGFTQLELQRKQDALSQAQQELSQLTSQRQEAERIRREREDILGQAGRSGILPGISIGEITPETLALGEIATPEQQAQIQALAGLAGVTPDFLGGGQTLEQLVGLGGQPGQFIDLLTQLQGVT
jgi:hypothetical protein